MSFDDQRQTLCEQGLQHFWIKDKKPTFDTEANWRLPDDARWSRISARYGAPAHTADISQDWLSTNCTGYFAVCKEQMAAGSSSTRLLRSGRSDESVSETRTKAVSDWRTENGTVFLRPMSSCGNASTEPTEMYASQLKMSRVINGF